ncbi:SMP-30/gluconolactonase/LRE family protein [Citricoccus parietis]
MRAQQITDPITYHGEGPVWSEQWGGLRWVDMLAGDILTLTGDAGDAWDTVTRHHVASVAAAVRPRRGGGAVIGVEQGFALEDSDGSIATLSPVWASNAVRMNEGACDPDGRFYCGSMAYDQTPGAASLYRLDVDGRVDVVLDGVTISNGLDWSPDGSLAYYNDTPTGHVSVFDYDTANGLTARRSFVQIADGGQPDGLTVDAEGGVWVAVVGQGVIQRYRPDGRLDEVIEVPATKTTACTFGGEHLDRLFITTSREDVDTDADPLAGALFVAEVGVRGIPTRPFAG